MLPRAPACDLAPSAAPARAGLLAPRLAPLAARAWELDVPTPLEARHVLRSEAAELVDGLLVRVARGAGAIDVALGQGLAALCAGGGLMSLGFACVGDYARERLGLAESSARAMVKLALALRTRPLLWEAVRSGEVSARKALTVLEVARGDAEARWVTRAREETVRSLARAVRAEGRAGAGAGATGAEALGALADDAPAPVREESCERFGVTLPAEGRATVDRAMRLAGRLLGATAPAWQRLEAMCQELLGSLPGPDQAGTDGESTASLRASVGFDPLDPGWLEAARTALEEEHDRWSFLERIDPIAMPEATGADGETDPLRLDAALVEAATARARWDEVFGHLAMLLQLLGLWRDMGFADLGQYSAERLGMAERTFRQRTWLERRLYSLPPLRQAMREGRLSYEQARGVARVACEDDLSDWIVRAESLTVIGLRRSIDDLEAGGAGARSGQPSRGQMCAVAAEEPSSEFAVRLPEGTARLLDSAFRAIRSALPGLTTTAECLELLAAHFVSVWAPVLRGRRTPERRALDRDRGFCTVPGCSRAAVHAHHLVYRSRGGGDDAENLTSLCAAHHLHGVHGGRLRVSGAAPAGLRWELGRAPPSSGSALPH